MGATFALRCPGLQASVANNGQAGEQTTGGRAGRQAGRQQLRGRSSRGRGSRVSPRSSSGWRLPRRGSPGCRQRLCQSCAQSRLGPSAEPLFRVNSRMNGSQSVSQSANRGPVL